MVALVAVSFGAGATASSAVLSDQETAASTLTSGTWASTTATVAISAWDIRDSSSGTEVNATDPYSYPDGLIATPKGWTNNFSSSIYLQWDYNAPLPTGLAVTGATFNFRFIPNSGGQTGCYYFEVRRASTNALLATHGSTSSPVACHTGTTYTTFSTSLPSVTTTDIANDLRIRLFAKEDNSKPLKIDLATVTVSIAQGSYTLFQRVLYDQVEFGTTTPWSLSAVDGSFFLPASSFPTSFSSTRYLSFGFEPSVPSTATISSAGLSVTYQSATSGPTSCFYYEAYSSGGSLLGTHGSAGAPASCHTGSSSWTTYTGSLPEINTPAAANGVRVKMYITSSGSNKPRLDQVKLDLSYSF